MVSGDRPWETRTRAGCCASCGQEPLGPSSVSLVGVKFSRIGNEEAAVECHKLWQIK